ncbi:MAG: pyruvate kinase alpha/beta domain-containing protein [Promethearchaeota archaeon]
MVDVSVRYFEKGGNHTKEVLDHVRKILENRQDITDVIVATTRGETGLLACETFDPNKYNVVAVTHSDGFGGANKQELKDDNRKKIVDAGGTVLTATHAFSGAETGISKKLAGGVVFPVELFARLTRMILGDGVKVCMEIALMAADAGLIPDVEKDIICIAGTGAGADTACIMKPAYSRMMTGLKVKQILCKPEIARP